MNKMAKGALAIGVGAALLLGGGGTLATWNAESNASAGTIASGNLQMSAPAGSWTSNLTTDPITNVAAYKMVPGEKLTYTQDLSVTLIGDRLTANLKATGAVAKAFGNQANVTMDYKMAGKDWVSAANGTEAVKLELAASKDVQVIKARIVVDFVDVPVSAAAPLGNSSLAAGSITPSTAQTQALTGVGFKLEQNKPTTPAPAAP